MPDVPLPKSIETSLLRDTSATDAEQSVFHD